MNSKQKRLLAQYYAAVARTPAAPTPVQSVVKPKVYKTTFKPRVKSDETPHAKWARRRREGQEHAANPNPPEPKYYPGVGVIDMLEHMKPRLPSAQAWARAVPRYLRRPSRARRVK